VRWGVSNLTVAERRSLSRRPWDLSTTGDSGRLWLRRTFLASEAKVSPVSILTDRLAVPPHQSAGDYTTRSGADRNRGGQGPSGGCKWRSPPGSPTTICAQRCGAIPCCSAELRRVVTGLVHRRPSRSGRDLFPAEQARVISSEITPGGSDARDRRPKDRAEG
jgi:hypothetical protein